MLMGTASAGTRTNGFSSSKRMTNTPDGVDVTCQVTTWPKVRRLSDIRSASFAPRTQTGAFYIIECRVTLIRDYRRTQSGHDGLPINYTMPLQSIESPNN
jgi:hypothetical protein